MTDDEIQSLAGAVKSLLDVRDLTLRTELASARADVEALRSELATVQATVKAMPTELHASTMRTVSTLGVQLADALPAAVATAAERHLRAAMDRAVPPTEGAA